MSTHNRFYLEIRTNPETGEPQLFGKVGYTSTGPKTDKLIGMNLSLTEAEMVAGNYRDINGDPCVDGAILQC